MKVLGVSPDGEASHAAFRARLRLPFPLLADPRRTVARRYGVWGEKQMFGRTYQGVVRTSFLIDPRGRIERVWRRVRVNGHAAAVLEAVR